MVEKLTRDEIKTTDVEIISWDILGREKIKTINLVDCIYKDDSEVYTQSDTCSKPLNRKSWPEFTVL